jgi:hypothetical protein
MAEDEDPQAERAEEDVDGLVARKRIDEDDAEGQAARKRFDEDDTEGHRLM